MDEAGQNPVGDERAALGPALAAERERQGLTRADIAHRLHMSPSQVEALEGGDFAHLPKGTFLRGFVRNYAKALGVAPEPLLEMLAGAAPPAPAPRIVVPTQNIRFDPLGERFSSPYVKAATLAVVAVALAFAAMYWAMYVRPRTPAVAMHEPAKPAATAAVPAAPPENPMAAPAPAASDASAASASDAASSPASEAATTKATAPRGKATSAPSSNSPAAAPSVAGAPSTATTASGASASKPAAVSSGPAKRLAFHFTGDSWVEVRDAAGKVLFQKLNAAGSDAEVSGRGALSVIVGNAPEVEMTLDGKPFDLDPHTTVAVARFTLE